MVATAALHIGGRLQVIDEIGRIVRLDPAGKFHAREAGFYWSRGDVLSPLDGEAGHQPDEPADDGSSDVVRGPARGALPSQERLDLRHRCLRFRCERVSASERAASDGLRGRGTQ